MQRDKLSGALGLCRRAGKVTTGTTLVREACRRGKAALVILAQDMAAGSEGKVRPLAEHRGIPVHRVALTKSELARALGKEGEVSCLCVPREFLNLVLASL